VLGQPNQDDLK